MDYSTAWRKYQQQVSPGLTPRVAAGAGDSLTQ